MLDPTESARRRRTGDAGLFLALAAALVMLGTWGWFVLAVMSDDGFGTDPGWFYALAFALAAGLAITALTRPASSAVRLVAWLMLLWALPSTLVAVWLATR